MDFYNEKSKFEKFVVFLLWIACILFVLTGILAIIIGIIDLIQSLVVYFGDPKNNHLSLNFDLILASPILIGLGLIGTRVFNIFKPNELNSSDKTNTTSIKYPNTNTNTNIDLNNDNDEPIIRK